MQVNNPEAKGRALRRSFPLWASIRFQERIKPASWFAVKHLLANTLVAVLCAALVFGIWYPYPYSELAGGRDLFALLVVVDAVCGPLLTFVVYSPAKPRKELWRDIGTVVLLQLLALAYGLWSVILARPVYMAFEGDRFRIVAAADIDRSGLKEAKGELGRLSLLGPRLIGVRLLEPTDREYPLSIQLALQGVHPAFRPQRWVEYDDQRENVVARAVPLTELKRKRPSQATVIDDALRRSGLQEQDLGFLPLVTDGSADWTVIVSLKDGLPKLYLPIDGW